MFLFRKKIKFLPITLALLTISTAGQAEIPKIFIPASIQYNVPSNVLYAISLTETGTKKIDGSFGVWPYTLNFNGKGYFYKDRESLYRACKYLLKKKKKSFDIGLMQLNYKWHHKKSNSLWEITDPAENVMIGAMLMNEAFVIKKNWYLAAGHYHSPSNKKAAKAYIKRFSKNLDRINKNEKH